jgi:hypothetical protein
MSIDKLADQPISFKNAGAFETGLEQRHSTFQSLWIKIAKRHADETSVTYLAAFEVALWGSICFACNLRRFEIERWRIDIMYDMTIHKRSTKAIHIGKN